MASVDSRVDSRLATSEALTNRRRRMWLVLAVLAAAVSASVYWYKFHLQITYEFGNMPDLQVYRWGGRMARLHPADLYSSSLVPGLPFAYPPIAALVFAVPSYFSLAHVQVAMTAVGMTMLALCTWWSWGLLGMPRTQRRITLSAGTFAVTLWLEPVQQNLGFGQINLILMALVLGDLALPEKSRLRGVGIGLAAALKLTPAIFILYLFCTRRYRAAWTSSAVLASTIVLGFAILPTGSRQYWSGLGGMDKSLRSFLPNQSLMGLFSREAPEAAQALWLAAAVVAVAATVRLAVLLDRAGERLFAAVVCASGALLVSPISWTHHYVWLVPVLILLLDHTMRSSRNAGWAVLAGYLMLFTAWPMRINTVAGSWDPHAPLLATGLLWFVPHRGTEQARWTVFESVAGEYYLIVLLIIAIAYPIWWLRRHPAQVAGPALGAFVARPDGGLA